MFNLKEKISIARQVGIWSWVGRVAPLTALTVLALVVFFDFNQLADYVIGFVAVSFAIVAFTWWWWVIYAVRDLSNLLEKTTERFENVIEEIKKLKKDLKN